VEGGGGGGVVAAECEREDEAVAELAPPAMCEGREGWSVPDAAEGEWLMYVERT